MPSSAPDNQLHAIKTALANGDVPESLYDLFIATARAVIKSRGYRAELYASGRRWDAESIADVGHDWISVKLLERGDLLNLIQRNQTMQHFRLGLEVSFRQFLIGRRKRSSLGNLFHRCNSLLNMDPRFQPMSRGGKGSSLWGLAGWPPALQRFSGSEDDLIVAGFRLVDFEPLPSRPDARKESPVLREPDLARFIADLLGELGAPITLDDLQTVLRHRFDLVDAPRIESLDTPLNPGGGQTLAEMVQATNAVDPVDAMDIEERARDAVAALTQRQQRVLVAYSHPDATLTSVGDALGCSKSTVEKDWKDAMRLIANHAGSADQANAVHQRVIELVRA